ncbi:hypothetical protein [uncultured Ruminococcus sp.]|uniref:hypothetical protein n=1 Tax=uncultured Ruminococcus sp. TaxID=165186 RepID=UPI0025E4602F|nr:hypothetical protein [uncultured Ruminococcus sp.]
MENTKDTRAIPFIAAVIFTAADFAAAQAVKNGGRAFSHTMWDICGVFCGYFLLRLIFGRENKGFPVIACIAAMAVRLAQMCGLTDIIDKSGGFIGRLLGNRALSGDMIACMPAMVMIYLLTALDNSVPLWRPPATFAVLLTVSAVTVMAAPPAILLVIAAGIVTARLNPKAEDMIKEAMYLFTAALWGFACYALLEIQFTLIQFRPT